MHGASWHRLRAFVTADSLNVKNETIVEHTKKSALFDRAYHYVIFIIYNDFD